MAIMDDEQFKGELLGVLKEMQMYLAKDDASQERAKLDKPPKIGETQKEMDGGKTIAGAPGTGVAKMDVKVPDNPKSGASESISGSGNPDNEKFATTEFQAGSKPKAIGKAKVSSSESEEESKESEETLKSLLKDIKSALLAKQDVSGIAPMIDEAVQKALKAQSPAMMEKALTKMGFHPSKPDIRKYGLDGTQEVKKSEDNSQVEGLDPDLMKKAQMIDQQAKKSWHELGQERQKLGGFGPLFS